MSYFGSALSQPYFGYFATLAPVTIKPIVVYQDVEEFGATTAVSICSTALVELGDKPIADFNEGTRRATICAQLYPTVRDFMLRSHPWNCATRRSILSPLAAAPAFGYRFAYTLPADCLRVLSVTGKRGRVCMPRDYQLEGRQLLIDDGTVQMRYIWRNLAEGSWDAMLVRAMIEGMKASMAYPITSSTSLMQLLTEVVELVKKQARSVDAQENPAQDLSTDYPLIAARF